MERFSLTASCLVAFFAVSSFVHAQANASASTTSTKPTTPSAVSTPTSSADANLKHKCTPPEYPGRLAPDRRYVQFNTELTEYKECLQKFATDQKGIAQKHIDAGNAAVDEYNAFVAGINKLLEKDPKDEKKAP